MCRRGNKDVVIVRVLLGKGHALESVRGGKNDLAVRVISRSGSGGRGGRFLFIFYFVYFPFLPFSFQKLAEIGTLAEIGRAGGEIFFSFLFYRLLPLSPFSFLKKK